MTRRFSDLCFLCLYFPASIASAAQWENIPVSNAKPPFVFVAVDASAASHILVADSRSVHDSPNSGTLWNELLRVPAQASVTSVAESPVKPTTLLAATDQGLYASFDGGRHWSLAFRSSIEQQRHCTTVAFDPNDANLAAAGTKNGLFLSRDGGLNWDQAGGLGDTGSIIHLAFNPHAAGQLYLLAERGLFLGNLNENRWQEIAGASRSLSETAGEAEEAAEESESAVALRLNTIAVDPAKPGHLYLGTSRGIRHSSNGGQDWRWLSNHGLRSPEVTRLAWIEKPKPALFAATRHGVARYQPGQEAWQMVTNGLDDGHVYDLTARTDELWAATEAGIFHYQASSDPFADNGPANPHELLSNFVNEPTIGQVRDAAIRYAEVHPDKIARWRRAANLRALLPNVNLGLDRKRSDNVHVDEGTFPHFQFLNTRDSDSGFDFSITWQLGDLIWNSDQTTIDTRSKLMAQLRDDIVNEVTRTYFERRRLQVALLTEPPVDEKIVLEKELRIQELTALIDGLTGGYFSAQITLPNQGRL